MAEASKIRIDIRPRRFVFDGIDYRSPNGASLPCVICGEAVYLTGHRNWRRDSRELVGSRADVCFRCATQTYKTRRLAFNRASWSDHKHLAAAETLAEALLREATDGQ